MHLPRRLHFFITESSSKLNKKDARPWLRYAAALYLALNLILPIIIRAVNICVIYSSIILPFCRTIIMLTFLPSLAFLSFRNLRQVSSGIWMRAKSIIILLDCLSAARKLFSNVLRFEPVGDLISHSFPRYRISGLLSIPTGRKVTSWPVFTSKNATRFSWGYTDAPY